MQLKATEEYMLQSLRSIMHEDEAIYDPFYGVLLPNKHKGKVYYGYITRTNKD